MPGCPLRPAHQAAWSLELPPLLAIGVQLVGVSAAASRNSSTCASPYLQRPANRQLMSRVYALLQPAVAPLEPLLATVGLTAAYPSRQCICGERGGVGCCMGTCRCMVAVAQLWELRCI